MDILINYLFTIMELTAVFIMEKDQIKYKNMFKYKIKLKRKQIFN